MIYRKKSVYLHKDFGSGCLFPIQRQEKTATKQKHVINNDNSKSNSYDAYI